jgi:hypothetical protein
MTDDIRRSDSNLPDFRDDAPRGDLTSRPTIRSSGESLRTDIAGARALEPAIQSALGIARESADLLYHIVGFGIALVSGPKNSRPKYGTGRTRLVTPEDANVIPFPGSRCGAIANVQTGMDHDHHK